MKNTLTLFLIVLLISCLYSNLPPPLLFFQRRGVRSMKLASFLTQDDIGFEAKVYNIEGGMTDYALTCDASVGTPV